MRDKTELEKWLDRYYEKFNENYPIMITAYLETKEIVADIKKCIETNTTAREPDYDDNAEY